MPKTWNELTSVQLQNIAHQFYCYNEIIKDNAEALQRTTTQLYYQITKELLRGNKPKAIKKALYQVHPKEFVPHTKYIYERVERTKFDYSLTVGDTKYYGPGQRLRNVSIGEFSYVDAAFYQWTQTKKEIWLDVLCAALYRKKNSKASEIDVRKKFVKQAVDARADIFGNIPIAVKLAIATTYEGCRNHIADAFPLIFPKPIVVEGQTTPKLKKYVSFGEIVLEKIEGDPSKLQSTNNVLLYDFLNIINADILRIRRNKK